MQLFTQAALPSHLARTATPDDAVIFCGSGSTAAIFKLADILRLTGRAMCQPRRRRLRLWALSADTNTADFDVLANRHAKKTKAKRKKSRVHAVVIYGPMEHHSNILVWREDPGGGHTQLARATFCGLPLHFNKLVLGYLSAPRSSAHAPSLCSH